MSKNFIQPGENITLLAPVGGVLSGAAFLVGSIFGVAAYDTVAGAEVTATLTGVWWLPKATGAITAGAKVYWDDTAKNVTTTAGGNTLIGAAVAAAGSGDATCRVRLNGVTV